MSFYDDASLVFLAGGAAGKDGKVYNLKPVEELGSNLLSNGTFDDGRDWSFDNPNGTHGWRISGGTAICDDSAATANRNLVSTLNLDGDKSYRLRLDILQSAGPMSVVVGSTTLSLRLPTGTNLGYNYDIPASDHSGGILRIYAGTSNLQEIDNISVKEIVAAPADFTFTRGTNLTATRVGKDGYIEKGREQLLVNTVWDGAGLDTAPTEYSLSITGSGTSNVTGVAGQIRFTAPTSSDRVYLNSAVSTSRGLLAQSVFMDAVHTACKVDTLMRVSSGASATKIGIFEDGVEVDPTHIVQAGKRYTMVWNQVADAAFRFGMGCDGGVEGDVTLSKPQFETGSVATEYIENTSTSATATAGLLEDEPRFDYTGGGCPALLMEPTRTNYFPYSEYASGNSLVNSPVIEENYAISPEGVLNAFRIEDPSGGSYRRVEKGQSKTTSQVDWTFSVFVKKATSPVSSYGGIALTFSGGTANQAYVGFDEYEGTISQLSGAASPTNANRLTLHTPVSYGDYWRFAISVSDTDQSPTPVTNNNTYVTALLYANLSDDGNSVSNSEYKDFVAYGMQLEEGLFPTSYIPTYGSSATRAKEGFTDSYDQIDQLDLSSSGLNGEDVSWFFELKNNQGLARDSGAITIRVNNSADNDGSFRIYRANSDVKQFTVVFRDTDGNSTPSSYEMTSENPKVLVKRTWSTGRIQVYVDGALVKDGINLNHNAWYKLDLGGAGSTLELKQALAFPTVLSGNDSEILTGATSYRSFNVMRSALNYTAYE